jgi:hypothetical protein
MQTDCIPDLFEFVPVEGRPVVAAFDGGSITSDAGALQLGATDRAIHRSVCGLLPRRALSGLIEHSCRVASAALTDARSS